MSHTGHGRTVCTCGNLIAQCRCLDNVRSTTTVPGGCEECKKIGRVIPLNLAGTPVKVPTSPPGLFKVPPPKVDMPQVFDPLVFPRKTPPPVLDQLAKDDPLFDADMVSVNDDRRMLVKVRGAIEAIAKPEASNMFDGVKVISLKTTPLELAQAARVLVSAGKLLDQREALLRAQAQERKTDRQRDAEKNAGPGPGRND